MKCGRASPYGKFVCQLEKGHEGSCWDGMHSFTEQLDMLGRDLIFDVNSKFKVHIPLTKETTNAMQAIVSEYEDEIIEGGDYGYCPDCDQRMGEPMHNEGYD